MGEGNRVRFVRGLLLAALFALLGAAPAAAQSPKVLVVTKTTGTAHTSTAAGVAAIKTLGQQNGFSVEESADVSQFTVDGLKPYAAVVFLSTNGDILTPEQESAFQLYYRGGGGFVGIHDAARLETASAWFTSLIGARPNAGSPTAVQSAVVEIQDRANPAGRGLPIEWTRSDEWFNWTPNPAGAVNVIANLRERSYTTLGTGANGWEHPISWCRDFDGGRSFYTGMGRTDASCAEADFQKPSSRRASSGPRASCAATARRRSTPTTPPSASTVHRQHSRGPDGPDRRAARPRRRQEGPRLLHRPRGQGPSSRRSPTGRRPDVGRGWGTVHVYDPAKPAGQRVNLAATLDVFGHSGGGDRADQERRGPARHRAGPELRHQPLRLPALHAVRARGLRDATSARAGSPASPMTRRPARSRLSSEKPLLQWPVPEPLLLPHGRRHGLRQGRQPLRPHR